MKIMKQLVGMALALPAIFFTSFGADAASKRSINDSWEFRMPDAKAWTRVHLPHTYNQDAYFGRDYYRGKALYRRALPIDSVDPSKRYYIRFDAASKRADVSLNGNKLGSHPGGYTAFTYDITGFLNPGQYNLLEVTVDNDSPDIAPISADFTFWGGIYRDVWLIDRELQHFSMTDHGVDGAVYVSTPLVNEKEAVVEVRPVVTNDADKAANLTVTSTVTAPDGKVVATMKKDVKLAPKQSMQLDLKSDKILNPHLWSPDSPTLYNVKTVITDKKTKRELDRHETRTGFRWWNFDGEKGFSLNGRPMKLRGFNRHQDQAPYGVAVTDEVARRDIRLMKDLGANFIRISHYPQDDAIVRACDELGLLVWEEIPIVNIVYDTPGFADNCELNLTEMIRQHYNHPSVIAWGYMNEILLVTPGPDRKEWPEFRDRTVALAQRLEKKLKEEDPARSSVMAFNMTNLYNEIGLDLEDVAGWNLYHGWYVGELKGFNEFCEDQHRRYPDHPVIISEWGAGSDRRIHSDHSRPFDFSIEYQQKYVEHYLPFIEQTDYISGSAYWNFIDFNVAARQESMPRVNNKGAFYNDRTPKDVAYYFKAMWQDPDSVPVLHIASRDYDNRLQTPDGKHLVKVYSNLPEVTLTANGKLIGTRKTDNCFAVFDVELPVGKNSLMAASSGGIIDVMTLDVRPVASLSKGEDFGINIGSNCSFTSDLSNAVWMDDAPYSKERGYGYLAGEPKSTTSEIYNAADCGPLFQTWLSGPVEYRVDAPQGTYEVELFMADTSRPAPALANLLDKSAEKASEAARCDVLINGNVVEKGFSPADGGFYQTAFRRKYIVDNSADAITVRLNPLEGTPTLAAIKLVRLD